MYAFLRVRVYMYNITNTYSKNPLFFISINVQMNLICNILLSQRASYIFNTNLSQKRKR